MGYQAEERSETTGQWAVGSSTLLYQDINVNIGDTKVCAGTGTTDTCNGDSGGPLLADNIGQRWSVLGITSFGVECGRPDFPGVYTRVDRYLEFIRENM